MFEGLKAKKLGLKDLGPADSKILNIDTMKMDKIVRTHVGCKGKLRDGRKLSNGVSVMWCSKCGIIWD